DGRPRSARGGRRRGPRRVDAVHERVRSPESGIPQRRASPRRSARGGRGGCYRLLAKIRRARRCHRRHRHLRRVCAWARLIQAFRVYGRESRGGSEASDRVASENIFVLRESPAMTIKVAINGYGRIGRNVLRAHYEGGKKHDLAIVALNDLGSPETNAHLTRYDTAHGKFPGKVTVDGDAMVVDGDRI